MFLYAFWTLILTAPIHSIEMLHFSIFFWWINKRIYISDGLRANLQQFFIFEWTIPLKCQFFLKDFQAFCKLYFYFIFAVVKTTVLLADINDFNNVNDVYKQCEYE